MNTGLCSINNFKSKFTSVRPNRFRVNFPQDWESKLFSNTWIPKDKSSDIYIYCKSASLPASKITYIQIPYLGRMYYDSGDREFDTLSLEFYNSQDFAIRNFFEQWLDSINKNVENYQIAAKNSDDPQFDIFMDELTVTQLDRRGNPIKSYKFYGVFPVECGDIRLNYDENDSIETFTVTLQYQWWETEELKLNSSGSTPGSTTGQGGHSDSEIWRGGGGGNGWTIISPTWTPGGITRGGSTRGGNP